MYRFYASLQPGAPPFVNAPAPNTSWNPKPAWVVHKENLARKAAKKQRMQQEALEAALARQQGGADVALEHQGPPPGEAVPAGVHTTLQQEAVTPARQVQGAAGGMQQSPTSPSRAGPPNGARRGRAEEQDEVGAGPSVRRRLV